MTVTGQSWREPPVRVTHVVFDLHGGGLESLVEGLVHQFEDGDVRLSVVTLSGRVGRVGASIRDRVDQFHVVNRGQTGTMFFPRPLARVLRTTAPDVVHLHSGAWLKGLRAARLARVPRIVYTEHGLPERDTWIGPALCRLAAHDTDAVIAVSDTLARRLEGFLRLAPGTVRTIGNGVDVGRFSPGPEDSAIRATLGIPGDARVVGTVGRLAPVKALDRLLRSFAEVRQAWTGPDLFLVLFGEGSERDALTRLAHQLGVAPYVRMPGWIDDPVRAYRLLDVFALTSRSEGVPLSLLEAMATGVPPVVTAVGANQEVLGPDLEHLAVPSGDHLALVHALMAALLAEHVSLGRVARQRIHDRYNLQTTATEYRAVYRGS